MGGVWGPALTVKVAVQRPVQVLLDTLDEVGERRQRSIELPRYGESAKSSPPVWTQGDAALACPDQYDFGEEKKLLWIL